MQRADGGSQPALEGEVDASVTSRRRGCSEAAVVYVNPSVGYADSSPKKGAKMVRRKITGIPLAPSDEGAVAQATEGEIIPRIAGHENQRPVPPA